MQTVTTLTTKQLAEAAERPLSTVKRWVEQFDIPHEQIAGANRYPPETADLVRAIGVMLDDGKSMASVRFVLGAQLGPVSQPTSSAHESAHEPVSRPADTVGQPMSQPMSQVIELEDLVHQVGLDVVEKVVAALRQDNELAEKYAKAAHHIGTLEAQLAAARAELARISEGQTAAAAAAVDRIAELQDTIAQLRHVDARETSLRIKEQAERARLAADNQELRDRATTEAAAAEEARANVAQMQAELAAARVEAAAAAASLPARRPFWKFW